MQSAHLPDGLDYGDWTRNNDKYINRIITKTNWAEKIGYDEKIASQKTVVIALNRFIQENAQTKIFDTT